VIVAAALARAIETHTLVPSFEPSASGQSVARVDWPRPEGTLEHERLMDVAERCGVRRELQAWLLQSAACHVALATRAGRASPLAIDARRTDFGRLDVEAAAVRWGIDPNLLLVRYVGQRVGLPRVA
jgi:EAL domain-containing protein (putative c-di-GMP-specific phosphodiesterase class I)